MLISLHIFDAEFYWTAYTSKSKQRFVAYRMENQCDCLDDEGQERHLHSDDSEAVRSVPAEGLCMCHATGQADQGYNMQCPGRHHVLYLNHSQHDEKQGDVFLKVCMALESPSLQSEGAVRCLSL